MFFWLGVALATLFFISLWINRYKPWRSKPDENMVKNQAIVKFVEGTTTEEMNNIHTQMCCTVMKENEEVGFHVIEFDGDIKKMVKSYQNLDQVDYIEPNYIYSAFYTPNDPYLSYQYGLQRIQAAEAWDVSKSRSSVKIAIIDSGVQLNHPDLSAKMIKGYDFVENDSTPNDQNGHGTHVAGIAAGATNNRVGMAGVAPLASILPVRVLGSDGNGTLSAVAEGIIYAANQGAKVINLSLGSTQGSTTLQNAVNYAWSKGAVLIGAAGNSGVNVPNYPAYYANVIAVASTDTNDRRSTFSNFGTWVDVAAPGTDILSTYLSSSYGYLSGTSMAAPHVAGIAALLASQGKTNIQIRDIIRNTADPILGTGTSWRYGRVNANRAVKS
ncbi:S8 family peptidase [Metabacillus iocasae]|uniref:Thermitase n=1 Tax=Priestia iocasae TaxID=2291674 RepID=A0ABS2QTU4_9BACI|nr:thermitase [Metabacillus iocasae]